MCPISSRELSTSVVTNLILKKRMRHTVLRLLRTLTLNTSIFLADIILDVKVSASCGRPLPALFCIAPPRTSKLQCLPQNCRPISALLVLAVFRVPFQCKAGVFEYRFISLRSDCHFGSHRLLSRLKHELRIILVALWIPHSILSMLLGFASCDRVSSWGTAWVPLFSDFVELRYVVDSCPFNAV